MKFFIVVVLALAVCSSVSAQTPGGWTPIRWNSSNTELKNVLDFGLGESIADAITTGELSNTDWGWIQIKSIETQVVDGMNYAFDVYIFDHVSNLTLIEFVVYENLSGNITLVSWDFPKNQ